MIYRHHERPQMMLRGGKIELGLTCQAIKYVLPGEEEQNRQG